MNTPNPLTKREMEIVQLIAAGLSNPEIAHELGNSPQTVKNQISAMLAKIGGSCRTHAVLIALTNGWMTIEDVRALCWRYYAFDNYYGYSRQGDSNGATATAG